MKNKIGIIFLLVTMVALLAAVACGSSSTAPPPTDTPIKGPPPPTETLPQGDPPPEQPANVEVLAPIDGSKVIFPATPGGDYALKITSGLPNCCAEFGGYEVERDGDRFMVEVTNSVPHPSLIMACTEMYGSHVSEVVLGGGLVDGEGYTVQINGEWTHHFIVQDADGMTEQESPIELIEIFESDGEFFLNVISQLPLGSSCSRSHGYTVNTRFAEQIEVSLFHLQVTADNVPCTADLPVVVTTIPLGGEFEAGKTYTVVVNGTRATFPEDELAMVNVPAPIETASVVRPEIVDGVYTLELTSGLPSGCAQFGGAPVERDGNRFLIEVTNLVPDPKELISCTAIYGIHDEMITLGSGLTPGEAYTVTINGDLTISFTALDEAGLTMVEKESPIDSVDVDGDHTLTVVSRLPMGSSCSRFNGYEIDRRFFDRIEVKVTHMEVAEDNVPCTPVVVTEIPLGENFEAGRTYTVFVNDESTTFTVK